MKQTSPVLMIQIDPETGLLHAEQALATAGLEVRRSFDLRVARSSHTGCPCPHHQTDKCSCQMAIILVYGADPTPVALMVHGLEKITRFAIVEMPGREQTSALVRSIWQVLVENVLPENMGSKQPDAT